MKHLVIAEKPSVGRDIARVLGCSKKTNSYMEGKDYIVTWALGHLVTLADPEAYGEKYKKWDLNTLPMLPEQWKLVVIPGTSKQYKQVKELLFRKDVSDIIIATDAGREGEPVARWILDKSGCKKPLKRLWISSVTDKAIKEGFNNLRPGKDYYPLYKAAVARAKSDWVVGINATRALTCKYNAQLSCGRVQTPTLAMINERENEIKNFVPKDYYELSITAGGTTFKMYDKKTRSDRYFNKEYIDKIYSELPDTLKVTEVKKQVKKSYSPLLYDLTSLQRDASSRFGFSAKETLNIMQRLYENHKVLTYPRTDSRYLTTDIVGTLKERLKACAVGPYAKVGNKLAMHTIKANKSFINNEKVSDHHAIIPTEQFVDLSHMANEERKIYDLVVRRFMAVLSAPCEYDEVSITLDYKDKVFKVKGQTIKSYGWREIYSNDYDDCDEIADNGNNENILLNVKQGDQVRVASKKIITKKTTPPARFTEGTLLSAMENPVKYMTGNNKAIASTLGKTGGLGTVATRADIIEKLFGSFLMEKRGKEIYITSKGKQLLELVPEDLKKPELTGMWEQRLEAIAKGKESDKKFLSEIDTYTVSLIDSIKKGTKTFHHDNLTRKKCPECGKFMLEVNGKYGKMLVCQDRECGYRETISKKTNARCPVCHKKMELIGKGDGQKFICSCGYKEKLSSFQNRRKKEGKGAGKKDVNAYLRKQAKEAAVPINNSFAEAFSKIKLD